MGLAGTIDALSVCDHCGKKYRAPYDYWQCVMSHCVICGMGTHNFFCELQLPCRRIAYMMKNPVAWSTDPDKRPLPRPDRFWGITDEVVKADPRYL